MHDNTALVVSASFLAGYTSLSNVVFESKPMPPYVAVFSGIAVAVVDGPKQNSVLHLFVTCNTTTFVFAAASTCLFFLVWPFIIVELWLIQLRAKLTAPSGI